MYAASAITAFAMARIAQWAREQRKSNEDFELRLAERAFRAVPGSLSVSGKVQVRDDHSAADHGIEQIWRRGGGVESPFAAHWGRI
ncbi:hypothetical protein ASC76_10270 [Rhizobacter sp. Root404]|nr:hypothetical protein ASC76_10270 [Rhizobacter sp. Root404]